MWRSVLPHIKDTYGKEDWDRELDRLEEQLPYDDLEYINRYAPTFKRAMRLSDLRRTMEEGWLESIRMFRDSSRDVAIAGVFRMAQFAILVLGAFQLATL